MSSEEDITAESIFNIYPRSDHELVPTSNQRSLYRKEMEPEKSYKIEEPESAVNTHILNAKEIQENEDQAKAKSDDGPMSPF
jgi:hypothetical protein